LENVQSIGGYLDISDNPVLTDISALNNLTTLDSVFLVADNPSLQQVSGFDQLSNFQGMVQITDNENLFVIDGFNGMISSTRIYITSNTNLSTISGFSSLSLIQEYLYLQYNVNLLAIDAFSQLTEIGDYFYIRTNYSLEDLSGFGALTTIGTDFFLSNNDALTDLESFSSLTTIGRDLEIDNCESLVSLTPTNVLNEVGGNIEIRSNEALIDISGFGNLTQVNGILEIRNNDLLADLTGVNNIKSVESLRLVRNEVLADLSAFSSLDTIHSTLRYDENPAMVNFAGLSSLDYALRLEVFGSSSSNSGIQNFIGLEGLTTLDSVFVINNGGFLNFNGLNNLTTITDNLAIYNNPNLEDFSGLNNLVTVPFLSIGGNETITNCNGFDNLEAITDKFLFNGNNSVINFEGFENLQTLSNGITVENNESLVSLAGLEFLTEISSAIFLRENPQLVDISAIVGVPLVGALDTLSFVENGLLEVCGQENICNYVLSGGAATFALNAEGCSNSNEVIESCFSSSDFTSLVGNVYTDVDQNCMESAGDGNIPNSIVWVENDQFSYGVSTDEFGNYWLPLQEGEYMLNVISPISFWQPCFEDSVIVATAMNDTIQTDLFLSPLGDCPYLDWNLTMPSLRICASRDVVIDFCNYGALPAEDAIFSVQLDTFLTLDSASMPYTIDADGNILFELETIDLFECGQIVMSVFLDCDSVELNQIQCIQVDLLSDELCDPNTLWDGSIVKATGYCESDSVFFTLENIGTGNMSESAQFRVDILIDDIVLLHDADDFQLNAGGTEILSYAINDSDGFHLEADQTTGFPVDVEASAVVPNCNDALNDIILTLFPLEDGDPFSEIFCVPAVNSYDPNIKTARPIGVGPNHEIDKDWELDYTIQFQNTGNDVAYIVVIKDTLSENADISTLRVKGASHDFTWSLNPERELVFTFEDINLPDSTSNEPESHGYVSYSLEPSSDILPGAVIENRAGIYFDFNEPIITNTVFHTIRKPVVVTTENQTVCAGTTFLGQLISQDTSVQELTSFLEYDSIHLYHLEVYPQEANGVTTSAEIGSYYAGVLIEGDTSFVVTYVSTNGCDSLVAYTISGLVNTTEVHESFSQVRLFPNPVNTVLQVVDQQNEVAQKWFLVNTLGQVVWEKEINPFETLSEISIAKFAVGVYWLEVQTENGSGVWRIVKE